MTPLFEIGLDERSAAAMADNVQRREKGREEGVVATAAVQRARLGAVEPDCQTALQSQVGLAPVELDSQLVLGSFGVLQLLDRQLIPTDTDTIQ